MLGPVVGAVASHVGTGPAFAAATVAGGVPHGGEPLSSRSRPPRLRQTLRSALPAIAEPAIAVGMWLTLLAGLAFGVIDVLVPLRLNRLGAGAVVIAGVFLGAGRGRGRAVAPSSAGCRTDAAAWCRCACRSSPPSW